MLMKVLRVVWGVGCLPLLSFFRVKWIVSRLPVGKKEYVLFVHGSVSDTFAMASLLDAFAAKYGSCSIIASESLAATFRVFCRSPSARLVFVSEERCLALRRAVARSGQYRAGRVAPGIVIPLHIPLYGNLNELVNARRVEYRDALTFVMGLDRSTPLARPRYSENDRSDAAAILAATGVPPSRIALLNPVTYTHAGLSAEAWNAVASAFVAHGFHPVFNVRQNAGWPVRIGIGSRNVPLVHALEHPTVNIPAHLVPLCASLVGIGCARWGGGFDLLHSYSEEPVRCLLIWLEGAVSVKSGCLPDPSIELGREIIERFAGRFSAGIVLLRSADSPAEAKSRTLRALQEYV